MRNASNARDGRHAGRASRATIAPRPRRIGANGKAKRAGRPPKGRRGRKGAKAAKQPFIILTGLSGSGKSQAIRALEDLGYFCVDNLPTTLIPTLAALSARRSGSIEKAAIVVDVRERDFLSKFPTIFHRLRGGGGLKGGGIFLEASNEALVRRFSETRRPHPLAPDRSVREGIADERAQLNAIREMADEIVDTSDMTVHELRQFFMNLSRDRSRAPLVVTLLSFGYKHGVPVDADLAFDMRCLPNPHFVPALRRRTGRDRAVAAFMEKDSSAREFMNRLEHYVRYVIPHYVNEGKSYLTIAIGCTGGRHRSVMVAERLRRALANIEGARVRVRHRDIANA